MIKYEDVKHLSTEEYFQGNQFSIDASRSKYSNKNETHVQALKRVCDAIASVEETKELQKYWSERWFDEIFNQWWHPAGSIMQGAGSDRKISLQNCVTISMGGLRYEEEWDNLESIIKNSAFSVAKSAAYRQGLGIDFSRLRPVGTKVLNSSNQSQGAIHWMKFIDNIGYYVGQTGRIPAMLFSLACDHPDVEEFIACKSDYTKIQNANISVQCWKEFYKAAEKNLDWELKFEIPEVKQGEKVYIDFRSADGNSLRDKNGFYFLAPKNRPAEKFIKTVKARELLELIAKNMWANAEPGIQNIDVARKYSNSDYLFSPEQDYDCRILSTNACQPNWAKILTKEGIRNLSDINIGSEIWSKEGWTKVVNKFKTGIKQVYEYRTTSGIFYGTSDHKVVSRDTKIEVEQAETIDIFAGPYDSNVILDPQDVMDGIVLGDGSVHKASSNLVHLYIGKDDQDYFTSEIHHLILKHRPGLKNTVYEINTTITYEELVRTYNRSIPTRFLFADKNKKCGFLRGLFSANGGISGERVTLKATSIKVIQDVQLMLSSVGIKSYITTNKSKSIQWKNGDYTSKESYDINITVDRIKFFSIIGFVQKYKEEKLKNLIDKLKPADKPPKQSYDIISKNLISEEEVFEITVDNTSHTYWSQCCNISNCSEQYLSRDSNCCLSSANQERFSTEPEKYEEELATICPSLNRFLDNVNEYESRNGTYPTTHHKLAIDSLRRTGAGYTNIAAWLFKQNLEYGSPEANKAQERFTERFNYYLYKSSIELGKEKGNFKLFNKEKFEQSPFIQRMTSLGLKFKTMRNVTCSSIAPTGTLSLMFRNAVMSYGIEPAFGLYFWKRTRISGHYEYYFCVPHAVKEVFKEKGYTVPLDSDTVKDTWDGKIGKPVAKFIDDHKEKLGIKFKSATEISPFDKLDLMSGVMKWIDSSISTTYLLPEGSDWKSVYDFILLAHKKEVKSIAAFPDKKMYGIVSFIPFKELAYKLLAEGIAIHPQNFCDEELKELAISKEEIKAVHAPKRPKNLPCDISLINSKGKEYFTITGLMNGKPYEVFAGENDKAQITKKYERGEIVKVKRGHYSLIVDGDTICDNISDFLTDEEEAITRLLSSGLRHGISIEFLLEQLSKVKGQIHSFGKVISRVLKPYIKENTKVTGANCPNCGDALFYSAGCRQCSCGFSSCS